MKPVTDPAILQQLNGSPGSGRKPVSDPAILAQLNGEAPQMARIGTPQEGVAETLAQFGSAAIATPVAGVAGLISAPFVGAHKAADIVHGVQNSLTYQPRTAYGQETARRASYPFEKLGQLADYAGRNTTDATGSPAAGAAVNTAIQSVPALLTRGRVKNGRVSPSRPGPALAEGEAEAPRPAAPPKAGRVAGLERVPEKAPSIEELRIAKDAAYKRAEDAGIKISGDSIKGLKATVATDLKKEGLNKKLHPDTAAALDEILKSKGDISLSDLETLRKVAGDAQKSIKPADARLASKIVDHIDDFIENLSDKNVVSGDASAASALKEARGLYSRMKKAEEIDNLIERARISAPNFSGSGMENALRTEFRALAKNDRKMRRFTPEERAAIKKVAMGGPMENILRQVGKLAPTGVVSGAMSTLAGMTLGGPMGAVALPVIGTAGRMAATRMTINNATRAGEIMRAGPKNALREAVPRRNALADQ